MRPTIPIVLLATTVLTVAAFAAAQEPGPEVREESDKFVLQNDEITVWFHGKKPMLKVFSTTDGENESAAYAFKFHRIVEYRDVDDDGIPSNQEILSSLNLERASQWEVTTTEDAANDTITLNLTVEAPVRAAGGVLPDDLELPSDMTARLSLVFTISGSALDVDTGAVNLTVPQNAVKYDLIVDHWPFVQGADAHLALEAIVAGDLTGGDVLGLDGATVQANGTNVGILAWTSSATGVTTDGESVDVPVRTQIAAASDGEAENATSNATESRLVHTFQAANLQSLVYDPVIGVATVGGGDGLGPNGESSDGVGNGVPAPGALLVVAGVAAAAVVARRR